jgi:YjjG family noncanonical pyrimidine nucleotidase
MKDYRWILFDADHTLFDFDQASEEALSEMLAGYGLGWKEGMYADYKKINVECWREHENGLIDRDTLVYERFRRYFHFRSLDLDPVVTHHEYLFRLGRKAYLMPGAEAIMDWLHGRKHLGYITNGLTEVQRPRMQQIGWDKRFDIIIIAEEIGHSKPHRAYFEHVHQQIGSPDPEEVLVVGDSLSADIDGALKFGYHTCWYNPGGLENTLPHAPQYMITHLEDLRTILTRSAAGSGSTGDVFSADT